MQKYVNMAPHHFQKSYKQAWNFIKNTVRLKMSKYGLQDLCLRKKDKKIIEFPLITWHFTKKSYFSILCMCKSMDMIVNGLIRSRIKLPFIKKKDGLNRTTGCEVIQEKRFGHVTCHLINIMYPIWPPP